MPLPLRPLPLAQNWDCHACGQCCKQYRVDVTDDEAARIRDHHWETDPEMQGCEVLVKQPGQGGAESLNQLADGSCVFLRDDGRCRIHAKFGADAKPLACRIYPFVLVPDCGGWRVGLRFSCPSVTGNKGRPLDAHRPDLREYADAIDRRESVSQRPAADPRLQPGQSIAWPDLHRFVSAFVQIVSDNSVRLTQRIRRCLALVKLCRKAKFDKVTGRRLDEFLELLVSAIGGEVAESPGGPGWLGRLIFRQTAANYLRCDSGPRRGVGATRPVARLVSAWKFARGRGRLPRVHEWLPDVTFAQMEATAVPLSPEAEALLTRYYRVKLESMQFHGPTNFEQPFWDGLESLLATYPVIRWLARAWPGEPSVTAIDRAVQIVDDNFGYHQLLGTARHKLVMRYLAAHELDRLIVRYSPEGE